jgi:protein-S-isoprenylcysteine O-methyltransferase Ste14
MLIAKLIIFILATLALAYISRASLSAPRSHGFYRFFAWEAIVVLFLLNMEVWFTDPLSWHQLISWIILVASLIPLILGVRQLRKSGKQNTSRDDTPLLEFEKTTELVTTGIYHYIRHPLYSSLLFLAWGILFKDLSFPGLLLAGVATLLLDATARADETECISFFGPPYEEYMQHTKRFIPFLF